MMVEELAQDSRDLRAEEEAATSDACKGISWTARFSGLPVPCSTTSTVRSRTDRTLRGILRTLALIGECPVGP